MLSPEKIRARPELSPAEGKRNRGRGRSSARRLWVRLQQLGASPLLPAPGLGDDQEQLGYDAALQPWSESLWSRLLEPDALPLPAGTAPQLTGLLPPRFAVENIDPPSPDPAAPAAPAAPAGARVRVCAIAARCSSSMASNSSTRAPQHRQNKSICNE